jgi:hyperosmotically inducible periplasmic protein
MKLRNLVLGLGVAGLSLFLSVGAMASEPTISGQGIAGVQNSAQANVQKNVRHELNMLAYVNAFDYMTFTVDANGNVTLNGEVTNPVVKSDAANVVKRVEGVGQVKNKIQVLPLSFFDNGLRARLYRTIYGYGPLQRYAMGVEKPIRIIVENGHVTLLGVVDNQGDKILAGMRANGVPGIFSVDNQLMVVKG